MRKETLKNWFLFICLVVLFCSLKVEAQSDSCNLEVIVEDNESKQQVVLSEIQIINLDTKTLYKPIDQNSLNLFESVETGKISVAFGNNLYGLNYRKTKLNCEGVRENNTKQLFLSITEKKKDNYVLSDKNDLNEIYDRKRINIRSYSINDTDNEEKNPNELKLVKPKYPEKARSTKLSGKVRVKITADFEGNVIYAKAISGDPLLREEAEIAAVKSSFKPIVLKDTPVIVSGVLVYHFVP